MIRYVRGTILVILITLLSVSSVLVLFTPSRVATAETVQDVEAQEAKLKAELAALELEIAAKQKELDSQKGQSASISRDISVLTTQINKAKLDIKARQLTITKLTGEINQKSSTIETLEEQMVNSKNSLSQILRKTNEIDDLSIVNVVLSSNTLSNFYGDVDSFASLKRSMKVSLDLIKENKTQTETEKDELKKKQDAELDAKAEIENAKHKVEVSESQKKQLLAVSKDKEKSYQTILADRQKKAAQIRATLFALRDTSSIPFGDALVFAEEAQKKTGVRPAFLLAILTQESALGKNVGSCYLTDPITGAGIGAKTGTVIQSVMKPSRDVAPFLEMTKALGRDPYKTLVSCPIAGYGYGGAMGPAQFIPSTWKLFQAKIATTTGHNPPNPWLPEDAFMASALYLADLGAGAGTYTAEKSAACRYYGGGSGCTAITTPYGNSVMAKATTIQQTMIDPLKDL